MSVLLGLGSNLGDRCSNLEKAVGALAALSGTSLLRWSTVYESEALLAPESPPTWDKPFLNLAVELSTALKPHDLLAATQEIERRLGRVDAERWAPRIIDVDMLAYDDETICTPDLVIPHVGVSERAFVLAPLAEIVPSRRLPGTKENILQLKRRTNVSLPAWMSVINVTPDSFSDGGRWLKGDEPTTVQPEFLGGNYIDVGGESTRPGAVDVDPETEWRRVAPVLEHLDQQFSGRLLRPKISIDTRSATTASRAIEAGASIVNDVSGLADPAMIEVLAGSRCDLVLMHSLSVPADPTNVLPLECDPLAALCSWFAEHLETLGRAGIALERVIIDPGIGFGKTATQSLEIIGRARELMELDCRVMFGHSRKSYLESMTRVPPNERDPETLAVSARLASRGVDILRVHTLDSHRRFWRVYQRTE